MRSRCTDFILFLLFSSTHALLFDNEVEASASPIGKMPHAVRHVEFIGTTDNGTLDCTFPGFTHYRWELINKVSAGPYAESSTLILDGKIKRHQSKIKIGKGGLPMATEMLVVSCELMKDDRPKFQIIWVVTRLPSPLGYPTDPRLCNYKEHRYYWSSCDRYFWEFHTDCYHGNGADYKGYAYITKGNPPLLCHYWFLDRDGKNYDVGYGNEHRYCRNPTNDHSPWCFTADGPSTRRKEFCRVRECSDCMYGYGNGTFPQYRYLIEDLERDFPVYNGRTILTIKKGSGGKPRRCLTGNRWKWNLCRHRENKLTPHCYIAKEEKDEPHVHDIHDPRVELVKCRIPQCTVRQVWFLFLSSFDNPYLKESNLEHVEILLIHGQSMRLDFMAFGIHLTSGLSVSSDDPRLAKYAQNFKMEARAPPDGRSRIIIHNLHHEMSGNYFVQYVFEEADPRIQQNMYRGNFKLDVRIPMSLSIKPDKLKLCRGHSGSLSAHVSGGFPLFQGSLKWKHGYYERGRATLHEVSVDDPVFKLSADFKRLTAKEITKHTWIVVEGIAHSGITSALALFQLKPQPHLVPKSATRIFALPGDGISMTVEMEKGLRTTWTYDAQFIPEVPEDPELAFERSLKKDIITESLVISSLDWRHYGTYVVETKKDGCRETVLFTIEHDKERMMMEEANLTSSGEGVDENLPAITKSGECDVKVLKLGTYDEQNYAKNWTIEVPCYRKEENEGTVAYDHDVEELSPCSVITGYMFTTRTQREYRLLISGDERKKMVEYEGDVHMKKNYTVNNDDEAWTYEYFFAEPVPARYVRFVADQVDDSKCLFGLTLTGCTLAKSICRPETFTANDVLCGDRQSSLLNKEEVRQLPTCSLITGYEFTSNKSSAHTLMISGQNSMVLREYDGDIEIEIEYFQRHWLFHHTLAEHALARYVQFVPLDQDGGSLTMDNLQVTGCRLDQHWCNLDWATFRNLGIKCEEDQIFPIYNEHPVFELPSCSMITHYQFVGKRFKQHFFMISGYNPKLRRNFQEGLRIESFYYKDDEWVFVCSFDTLIAARFLQFVCDSRGNDTCLEKLTVSGCAVEESWCNDKLETRTVEHYRRRNFFHGGLGKSLLLTTIASFVIPILMFIVGKYSLDKRLINVLMRMAEKFRKKPEPAMTSNKAD